MPEVLERSSPTLPPARNAGRTGATGGGHAASHARPPVLNREDFRTVGRTLNGEHWQADIAKLIGVSRSQITRFLNGEREINPLLSRHMQYVLVERIAQLVACMDIPGMPYEGSDALVRATKQIADALALVPGQEPPRTR